MATYIITGVGGWITTVEAPSGQNFEGLFTVVRAELREAVDNKLAQYDWGDMDEEDMDWIPEQVDDKDALKRRMVAYIEEGYSPLGKWVDV